MLITSYNMAEGDDKKALQKWIDRSSFVPEEKIQAVTEIYNKVGIKDVCLRKIEELFNESVNYLGKVSVDDGKKTVLRAFADKLLKREK